MASLSITRAWNETAAFVAREGRLIFPIAFMLAALPVALVQAITPPAPAPNEMPEPGLWLALLPIAMLGSMIANLAISLLALRGGTAVGEALARGARRLPVLLGAFLLLVIAGLAVMFVVATLAVMVVPGAISAAQGGAPTPELATAILLTALILVPILLYFGARLTPITPLAAAEPGGPIALIRRSWRLTRGHVWKLVGFLVLIAILVGIVSAAIESVAGIIFALAVGPLQPGSLSALLVILVMAGVSTVLTAYLASLIARIYAQLSGEGADAVFS